MEGKRRGRYERRVKKKKENKWKEMRVTNGYRGK